MRKESVFLMQCGVSGSSVFEELFRNLDDFWAQWFAVSVA
jgi:hypothetical protein